MFREGIGDVGENDYKTCVTINLKQPHEILADGNAPSAAH